MRKSKKSFIFGIVLLFLFLGIGYAYLTTTLSINGTTDIDMNNWDVYFDNVNVTTGSVSGEQEIEAPTITSDTTVEYHVRLKEPGEFYEFTIEARNDGTIDAMIETINKKVNGETTIPAYLNYTVTYSDDLEIEDNHLLKAESLETYKIRVEYRDDINPSDLPSTAQNLTLSFGVSYIQSDSNAQSVGHYTTVYTISTIPMTIGEAVPDGVVLYSTAAEAMTAFSNRPFYLKHYIIDGLIAESYVEFIVTPEMVSQNPTMTAGTYSLHGGVSDDSSYGELVDAFGESNCSFGSALTCSVPNFYTQRDSLGNVSVSTNEYECGVNELGVSSCYEY